MMYTSQLKITLMTGFVVHILISTKWYAVYSNYRSFTNVMFMMYLLSQQVYICLISLCFLLFLYYNLNVAQWPVIFPSRWA